METEEIIAAISEAANTIASPNWAATLSAIASIGAVIAAILIAFKQVKIATRQNEIAKKQAEISDQQNKIALFEKRYEVYETTRICVHAARKIADLAKDINDVYEFFCVAFHDWPYIKTDNEENKRWISQFFEIADVFEESTFLYSREIYQYVQGLGVSLLILVGTAYLKEENKDFQNRKKKFCKAAEDIVSNNILEKMRKELQLQPIKV